jgi:chaperone modulatory protein CbpM
MIIGKQGFLAASGMEIEALEVWLERRWLLPEQTEGGPGFTAGDLARARLIQDLARDFGVNDEGIDVILHLVDQLHGMRRALAQLQKDAGGDTGERA